MISLDFTRVSFINTTVLKCLIHKKLFYFVKVFIEQVNIDGEINLKATGIYHIYFATLFTFGSKHNDINHSMKVNCKKFNFNSYAQIIKKLGCMLQDLFFGNKEKKISWLWYTVTIFVMLLFLIWYICSIVILTSTVHMSSWRCLYLL